jgi:hypothetical protein
MRNSVLAELRFYLLLVTVVSLAPSLLRARSLCLLSPQDALSMSPRHHLIS